MLGARSTDCAIERGKREETSPARQAAFGPIDAAKGGAASKTIGLDHFTACGRVESLGETESERGCAPWIHGRDAVAKAR